MFHSRNIHTDTRSHASKIVVVFLGIFYELETLTSSRNPWIFSQIKCLFKQATYLAGAVCAVLRKKQDIKIFPLASNKLILVRCGNQGKMNTDFVSCLP